MHAILSKKKADDNLSIELLIPYETKLQDNDEYSALMFAVLCSNIEIVKKLKTDEADLVNNFNLCTLSLAMRDRLLQRVISRRTSFSRH